MEHDLFTQAEARNREELRAAKAASAAHWLRKISQIEEDILTYRVRLGETAARISEIPSDRQLLSDLEFARLFSDLKTLEHRCDMLDSGLVMAREAHYRASNFLL